MGPRPGCLTGALHPGIVVKVSACVNEFTPGLQFQSNLQKLFAGQRLHKVARQLSDDATADSAGAREDENEAEDEEEQKVDGAEEADEPPLPAAHDGA